MSTDEAVPAEREEEMAAESNDSAAVVEDGANLAVKQERDGAPSASARRSIWQRSRFLGAIYEFRALIGVLGFFLVLAVLFSKILLPFILALVIVYLMEPIVGRVGYTPEDPTGIPRWLAVILVYLVFFGVLTTGVGLIAPRFVSEIVRFGEAVPQEVTEFRSERLPEINAQVQELGARWAPGLVARAKAGDVKEDEARGVQLALEEASRGLHRARVSALGSSLAMFEARRKVGAASEILLEPAVAGEPGFEEEVVVGVIAPSARVELEQIAVGPESGVWTISRSWRKPALTVVPRQGGALDVYLEDVQLGLEPGEDGGWRLEPVGQAGDQLALPSREESPQGALLDLEREVDKWLDGALETSREHFSALIAYAQKFVVGLIEAFVALILMLMVAAFISIDLHRVRRFFRDLVPARAQLGYDALLVEMDRGLSGVVRGQLIICLVNGVLTYIGLVILDIKFSLLLAVVAGVLSLIPIFGTILSTIPIVLFGLTDGIMTGVFALGWILGIHFIEANILNPKIIGTNAHIHPVIVIFALLSGESTFGLVGALLAVPTATILLTLFKFFVMRTREGTVAFEQLGADKVEH